MTKLALLVAATFFMEFLDATILNTALPRMAASMGAAPLDLNIGVSIYSLVIAVFILPSAWMVERFGARSVFASAIVVFTLSSIACGASQTPLQFDIARAFQGLGGAMMVPVGRLVVLRSTEKSDLMRAIALLTWPALTAPLLGPPLGGYLADSVSWRAIFFVNVPLGVVGAALAIAWTPRLDPQPPKPFDFVGFVYAGVALGAALIGLDQYAARAPAAQVLILALVSLVGSALLVRHIRGRAHAIVNTRPLAHDTFRRTMTGGVVARGVLSAVPFVTPLMFQLALGYDALRAGLMLTPLFVGNIGIKPLTTPILRRFGFRNVLVVNGLIQTAALGLCAAIGPDTPAAAIAVLLCVAGASRSMQFTALGTLPFADMPPEDMGMANLIFSVSFQASFAFGIGLGAAAIQLGGTIVAAPPLAAYHIAYLLLAALMAASAAHHAGLARDAGHVVSGRK
jgi:EmrB/QacA subfamily drug resistance transporter